jgi:hypothetical protein
MRQRLVYVVVAATYVNTAVGVVVAVFDRRVCHRRRVFACVICACVVRIVCRRIHLLLHELLPLDRRITASHAVVVVRNAVVVA